MNVDGSHHPSSGSSALGGILRDDLGTFVKGFYAKLSPCNALVAEMLALVRGIQLARSLFLKKIIFEVDSSVFASLFLEGYSSIAPLQSMLGEVIKLIRMPDWEASVHLV